MYGTATPAPMGALAFLEPINFRSYAAEKNGNQNEHMEND